MKTSWWTQISDFVAYVLLAAFLTVWLAGAVLGSDFKLGGALQKIENAFKAGAIREGDRIFYRLQAVISPQELPIEFKSGTPELLKCGTSIVDETIENWALLTPQQSLLAANYLARPSMDSIYISPAGQFMIHYDVTGPEAVPLTDDNSNLIPDYVERIGIYADSCRSHYQGDLAYLPVPTDTDSLYDIYLLRIGAYGITIRENLGDSAWDDYSSYIQIHCSFDGFPPNDDPEGDMIGAQKVTCAHEYYHATQLAYDGFEDAWWRECSATYFEEVSFPEVNDNYNYLPYFYNFPDTSLTLISGLHMYGAFVWPEFLSKKFGLNIQKAIWEECRFAVSLAAIDSALAPFGARIKNTFTEFAVWNYFTNTRHESTFFDSGADYPLMPLDQLIPSYPFTGVTPTKPPDGLGANYILSFPDTSVNGLLRIDFDGSYMADWGFSYIRYRDNQKEIIYNVPVDVQGRTSAGIYDFVVYDSLLFVPAAVSSGSFDNQYAFATVVCPFGDLNASGDLNILDLTYLLSYLYKNGPTPKYSLYMGDMNCNGIINILDVSYLINHLYKTGPPPCLYRP